ncbi:MAG: hypothetical protein WBE45_12115 [Terriglobales bacterium]|jgi:hypothetical protein
MATELHPPTAINHVFNKDLVEDLAESLTPKQKEALQRAVAKIVALGVQVGVNADQMIQLLRSGLTVRELLEYVAARTGDVA